MVVSVTYQPWSFFLANIDDSVVCFGECRSCSTGQHTHRVNLLVGSSRYSHIKLSLRCAPTGEPFEATLPKPSYRKLELELAEDEELPTDPLTSSFFLRLGIAIALLDPLADEDDDDDDMMNEVW